jgi:hypothetical protein
MEEGRQALGLDLQKVSRQDLSCNMHALEHSSSQKRVSFFPQVDREQLKLCLPTCLKRISNKDLILLLASPNAGARMVEGSGVQSKANKGGQIHRWNITEENGEVVIKSRHKAHCIYGKQLIYYTISRVFIDIPGIIVLYSFLWYRLELPVEDFRRGLLPPLLRNIS